MKPHEIKELMRLKQWKQVQLAEAIGVNKTTVCCWVHGVRIPLDGFAKIMKTWLAEARREVHA